jgi:hypothetical protein
MRMNSGINSAINSTRCTSVLRVALLALLTISVAQLPASAQPSGPQALYKDIFLPPIGLAPGQSLRFTLFNPAGDPVRAQTRLHHTGGTLIGLSDGSVRANAFHSFDFHHSDIPLPGEASTGRIQLRASVRLTFSQAIQPVVISMETFSIADGTSNTIFVAEIIPTAPGRGGENGVLVGGGARNILMGVAPGQTLRITLFNPGSPGSEYLPSRIMLFEENGRQIGQNSELVIPPGEFRSFDINYEALALQSGAPAGRRQIRVRLETGVDQSVPASLVLSVELMDGAGKTTVLAGNQCLVFYLGG